MSDRRANHLNIMQDDSDEHFLVANRTDNADVTGADFGFVKIYYDGVGSFQVTLYASDKTTVVAQSANLATSSLPATVTLAEYLGSGVSGTIDIDGVRT